MKYAFGFVVILQTILHYLGWLSIILSVIAFLFGNTERAIQLLISGVVTIALKYLVGLFFLPFKIRMLKKQEEANVDK